MLKVMFDYDGLAYTVTPCWIDGSSRIHYCGAYATSKESWRRVMELTPKKNLFAAWHDLNDYVGEIDRKAQSREGEENAKSAVPLDD